MIVEAAIAEGDWLLTRSLTYQMPSDG